jgi:SAM-dependent methyltransferase
MSKYADLDLQSHELKYWSDATVFNTHAEFYKKFFDFSLCENKDVLDVGCGGNPITDFTDFNINLSILDPLIDDLIKMKKYERLKAFNRYPISILELKEESKFDYVTCFNVIDHFVDDEFKYIDVFHKSLKKNGQLWLYYDVRPNDACDHLALNSEGIIDKIKEMFIIESMSRDTNPKHIGWSGITSSIRIIATKK